jgi:hypothetical protein
MSTRQLSNPEVFDFLSGHADIQKAVSDHEQMFLVDGHPLQWDQILAAQGGMGPVPIPPRGLSVANDPTYGNVIVFPDASGILHFMSTDNSSLTAEIQKPVYYSDPEYWQLFEQIAQKFQESIPSLPQIGFGIGAVVILAILILARH